MILGEESMAQTISIGKQDFLYLRENNYFYMIRLILSGNGGRVRMTSRLLPDHAALEKL